VLQQTKIELLTFYESIINEPPRGKPRGIFKGKIHFIAASCGELNPIDFASPFKGFV
jgi:hypothetical protein